jgi:hypothetical protein
MIRRNRKIPADFCFQERDASGPVARETAVDAPAGNNAPIGVHGDSALS